MSNKIKGKYGEDLAVNYLIKNGYAIVERNYRFSRYGEVDIIALDKDVLCFVEVKTRTSRAFGDPLEAINFKKQQKIRAVATAYLKQHHILDCNCRFDAIAVMGENDGEVNHIQDAF